MTKKTRVTVSVPSDKVDEIKQIADEMSGTDPSKKYGRKYPFDKLAGVGYTFLWPMAEREDYNRVRVAAARYAKRHGIELSLSRETNGIRVERTA